MIVIADTGPVISLAVIGKLDILDALFDQIAIPPAVWRELEKYIKAFSIPQVLKYKDCVVFVRNRARFLEDLDDGETEAIQLYSEMKADLLLIEDKDARSFAESQGISCMGTPGILILAKRQGLIPCLRPLFAELLVHGRYFSRSLLDSVLLRSGEQSL